MSHHVSRTDINVKEEKELFKVREENKGNKQLKARFVLDSKLQEEARTKNLEETLLINKKMLTEVLLASNIEEAQKKVLKDLNNENISLLKELNTITQENKNINAKLLIVEQIIQSHKNKEISQNQEFNEKLNVLKYELEQKESDLELIRYKHINAINLLKRHDKDKDIETFLNPTIEYIPKTIVNSIKERDELVNELKATKNYVAELEVKLHDLTTLNEKLKMSLKECEIFGSKKGKIPSLDFTKVRRLGRNVVSDKAYIHKLEESIKYLCKRISNLEEHNRILMQKNMQLKNSTDNFLKLNTDLTNSLKMLNGHINFLRKERKKYVERRASPDISRNISFSAKLAHTQSYTGDLNISFGDGQIMEMSVGDSKFSDDLEGMPTKSTSKKDINKYYKK